MSAFAKVFSLVLRNRLNYRLFLVNTSLDLEMIINSLTVHALYIY